MSLVFAIAIYFIIWWVTLFTVLPFGLRTQGEAGDVVPGTPSSAPHRVRIFKLFAINSVLAGIVFAIVWVIITYDLLGMDMMNFQNNSPV